MSTLTTITERPSPWWYRQRGLVMMAIYAAGFYGGYALWALRGAAPAPFFVWAGARIGPQGPLLVLLLATLLTIACWAIRAWGSAYLSAHVVWNKNARLDALFVDGPFRYVRNPLYLGNLFMALGVGVLAAPCGLGIIFFGNLLFILALIRYESAGLREQYGPAWENYERAVPALFPRLTPVNVDGARAGTPSAMQGLRAEIFSASMAIAMIVLLVLGERGFLPFMVIWIAGWFAQQIAIGRR